MTDEPGLEVEDAAGRVVVTFSVSSSTPIPELSHFLQESPALVGEYRYELGTTTFDEPVWEHRAERLRAVISDYLDQLERVPRDVLHDPRSFVLVFVTLAPGAGTIDAETVKRLAQVNATIWIDA